VWEEATVAGSFRIAEGYVEVTADESAYDRAMDRLRSKKTSASVLAKLDDKDAKAKLTTLTKERTVKLRANADTRAAATSLRELTKARTVKVTATLSKKDISADLRTLTKDRAVTITAKLADKAAAAALTKLTKERTVTIRATVETRVAAQELQNLIQKRKVSIGIDADTRVAAEELDRFLHHRSVTVDVNLDASALDGLATRTVDINAQINEPAYQRASAKLDKLTADRNIIIRPSVDTRVAAEEIRNLTARRKVNIGIDVDTRVAADSLANLTRRRSMTVGVNLNDTEARARLGTLTRNRTVNVRADVDRSAASRLASMFGGGLSGALSAVRGALTSVVGLAVQAVPTLASLGQAIMQMGPAAAVAAPAVLSLGAALATIKIGTSGIGAAFKQAFAPAAASAGAAENATRKVETAQRSLAKAQQAVKDAEVNAAQARVRAARDVADAQQNLKNTVQDVADANRRAAEQVEQAERDLADAQRSARQAQQDLNDARKEAAQDLEDLNNRLADAQLDQRQKVLDLQDAEKNLAAVKAKGAAATQEELEKAQLQYDKAKQALEEQQTETQRLQDQTTEANEAGVEGSKKVKDAKEKERDAQQEVKDKTKELKDAHTDEARTAQDGAQRTAKAQRDVADAQAAAAQAVKDGARAIADAQESAREAAQAYADAQNSGAAATSKTAAALAKLSPNARAFVGAVLAQAGAWRALKLDVQDALFAGLGHKFTQLSTAVIPSLRDGLVGMAGNLNAIGRNAADAVIQLAKTGQLRQMFNGLNKATSNLTRIPGQIITALTQISIAASPAFERLTSAAGTAADHISQKIADAFKSGALEDGINRGIEVAKQFGRLLGDVFGTVNNIMKAAAAGGGDALGALGSVFSELRRITAMPEVQTALTSIFSAVNAVAKLVGGTFGAVIEAALPLLAALAPVVKELAEKFGPVLAELASTLGAALMPIIDALLPIVSDIGGIIVGVVQAVMPLLEPLGKLIAAIVTALGPVISTIGAALVPVIAALAQGMLPVVGALVPVVQMLGQFLAQLAPIFPPLIQAMLPLVPPLAQLSIALLNLAMQVITPLMPLIVGLAQLLAGVLAGAIGVLVPAITTVIGWITNFANAVSDAVKWIVDKFTWLYDVLVGHSIIPDLVKAILSWFSRLWTKTKEIFTTLKNWVVQTWKDLWGSVRTRWDNFWSGLRSSMSGAWKWARDSVSSLKTSLTSTWSSMWNGARDKMSSIFSTINSKISAFKNGMKSAFSSLRDSLGTIWNGIKSKIASPVRWVVSNVYNNGIRRMWNTIAGKINSHLSLPTISLGFNKGGVVPGAGNTDTVPAMLTPGERILSKQQVTQLGGHRGIDAMLGQDKPTRTGGNPSRQQERQREQAGQQHFASGGIVGKVSSGIGGVLGSAFDWAKDLVIGGLKSAAQKAISSMIRPLIGHIPGAAFGGLLKGLSNKALDGMLDFLGGEDKKAVGGPAVQRALGWAKSQGGKPYQWAGNGNPSWDCSGFMSAIESVIRGEKPHRRWATGAFVGNNGPSGWVRNLKSPFQIGITNAGVGHTAGTLAGVNVESSGGAGVHYGKTARGYNDSLFTSQWGFKPATKYDSGGLLQPGATMAVNATRRPERILDARQTALFEQLVSGSRGGGSITIENISVSGTFDFSSPAERRRVAMSLADEIKEALRKLDNSRRR
jgi:phage-related protein